MDQPRVFISYSHDSTEHKEWVRRLAIRLRREGIFAELDELDVSLGGNLGTFMQRGLRDATRVLMICTPAYCRKSENGEGGVGYEGGIVTHELYSNQNTDKFIPIVRCPGEEPKIPSFLGVRKYIDFSNDGHYLNRFAQLKEALSECVARAAEPEQCSLRSEKSDGNLVSPQLSATALDTRWFYSQYCSADGELRDVGLTGCMELRFSLGGVANIGQRRLLEASKKAEVRTTGWPVVLLASRQEWRPKVMADGIRAVISIDEDRPDVGGRSHDYWSASTRGDFFRLGSLWEDMYSQGEIYFNTRIMRVTESLMFCYRFYEALGMAVDTPLALSIVHRGLKGRLLTSSSRIRCRRRNCISDEDQAESFIQCDLANLKEKLLDHVGSVTRELFVLFDFMEFDESIVRNIASRFTQGEIV